MLIATCTHLHRAGLELFRFKYLVSAYRKRYKQMQYQSQQAGAAGCRCSLFREGGWPARTDTTLYTTLGWLQRGMNTVARPDSGLAGKGHEDGNAVVVV